MQWRNGNARICKIRTSRLDTGLHLQHDSGSHRAVLPVEDRHGALSPEQGAAADQPRIFASHWRRALREASSVDVLVAGMVGLSCTIADRRGGATSDVKKPFWTGRTRQYRLATLEEAASILLVSSGGSNGQAGAF